MSRWMLVSVAALLLAMPRVSAQETLRVPQDFGTIQAAITAAEDGDTILVSKGTYAPFSMTAMSDVEIRGKGKPVIDALAPVDGGGIGALLTAVSGITLKGLVFVPGSAGVSVDGGTDVLIEKCTFEDGPGDGVFATDGSGLTVSKCRFLGLGGHGVRVIETDTVTVSRCRFEDVGAAAMRLSGGFTDGATSTSDGCLVEKNRIKTAVGDGLWLNGDDAIVTKNRFQDVNDGFQTDGESTNCCFEKNSVLRPGFDGFFINGDMIELTRNKVTDADDDSYDIRAPSTLVKNRSLRGGGDGFNVGVAGTGTTAELNKAVQAGDDGFEFDASDCVVTKNKAVKSSDDGFRVDASNGVVTGNVSTKAGNAGFRVNGTPNELTDNRAVGSANDGFLLFTSGNTLTGNTGKGSGGFDVSDFAGGNTYVDNNFKTENLP